MKDISYLRELKEKVVALVREFAAENPDLTFADLEAMFGRRHNEEFYILDALRNLPLKAMTSV